MNTPKEQQSAYQRWEMNSFGDERPSAVAARTPPPVLPNEEEIAAIRAQAHADGLEAGRAAGYQDGLVQARTELARELAPLKAAATAFGNAVEQADETMAEAVLALALDLARAMLHSALAARPELVLPVVRAAVAQLPQVQQPALLLLHPADAELVRELIGEELEHSGWRVVDEPQLGRGGCRIDTPANQVDAQLPTRWARLMHALGSNAEWMA